MLKGCPVNDLRVGSGVVAVVRVVRLSGEGEDVLDAGAGLLVGLVVRLLPVGQALALRRRWGMTSPVPEWPPSVIVVVLPTAALAPDSSHALQPVRLPGKPRPRAAARSPASRRLAGSAR